MVISIIALRVTILLPALQQTRYQAKRLICLTQVSDQATSESEYATELDGYFSSNNANGPQYMCSDPGVTSTRFRRSMRSPLIAGIRVLVASRQGLLGKRRHENYTLTEKLCIAFC